MELQELKRVVEALIFASDAPLTAARIRETLPEDLNGFDLTQVVDDLNRDYAESGRAFFIRQIAGGYQVSTRPELHTWVKKLFLGRNKMRLSHAALETLAIVAFKQPISRVDVAQIRGVNSDGVIGTLLERKLITISGRSEGVGRPLLYSTTPEFLQYFGVNDLADLPKPREIEELIGKEGMPEEVLQALSDDKQLELPINVEATPVETDEPSPAPAVPVSIEEYSLADGPGALPDDAAEAALPPARLEENVHVDSSAAGVDEREPPETINKPEALIENEIAEEGDISETDESVETEVDAIVVEEDPDEADNEILEEEDDTSQENGEEEKAALAPAPPPLITHEAEFGVFDEPESQGQPQFELDQDAASDSAGAPPNSGADFFLEHVRVIDLEALSTPAAAHPAHEEILAIDENPEPVQETVTPQASAEGLLPGEIEKIAEALTQAPAVHVVEIEQAQFAQRLQVPIEVAAGSPDPLSQEAEAMLIPAALAPDLQYTDEASSALQAMPASVLVTKNEQVKAASAIIDEVAENEQIPHFELQALDLTEKSNPPFFASAPSENGAQRSNPIKAESGVIGFFKKAVGWIKSAWQKLVGS